jgi:cytochrome c5
MESRVLVQRNYLQRNRSGRPQRTVGIVALVLSLVAGIALAEPVPPGSDDDIRERLTPFGKLCRAGESCGAPAASTASSGPRSGEAVYSQFCFACHATGASDAPLFGDAAAWAPRREKGMDALLSSTLNGIGMMPARGTCMNCSDAELEAAVDYILEQAQ